MNRLHYVNLVGVLALAALCVAQWQINRRLNLELNRIEKTRLDQAVRLAEQDQNIRGLNSDLAGFKEQLGRAQSETTDARQSLRAAEREIRLLTAAGDQLKASVTNWAAAVTVRDERLKEAGLQIRKLGDDLNDSIRKFNDLATNYNAVVKELNELRARPGQPQPPLQPAPGSPQKQ